jgi:hypothetical protein
MPYFCWFIQAFKTRPNLQLTSRGTRSKNILTSHYLNTWVIFPAQYWNLTKCFTIWMDQSFWQETYFQEFQSACKQNPSCQLLEGVDRLNCIRECISPSCYIELYQGDKVCSYRALCNLEICLTFWFLVWQLEVGEIDVRFESFKGCFIQRGIRRGWHYTNQSHLDQLLTPKLQWQE